MNSFSHYQQRINSFLAAQLDSSCHHSWLKESMAYSLLSGGKRIRPLLVYATAECIGTALKEADYLAAAIEMIHAYSLIHDDLPAMDNDELRRGQATNHIAFDEATAILAGDALQALAFETLSQAPTSADVIVNYVKILAQASGANGMAGGQSLDLIHENKIINLDQLEAIHAGKTVAILKTCVQLPILAQSEFDPAHRHSLLDFAENLGMAFQIIDDVLDVTQDTQTLGKPANSDTKNNKSTYPSLLGVDAAKSKANEHIHKALDALKQVPYDTTQLDALTRIVLNRSH